MLAEYHASPHARVVSLPLETNSTIFKTSHFSVQQENLQNNKHEFKNLQTILEHIENTFDSENRKEMLSDIKAEFEHIVQSTDINVLQDYLHSVYNNTFVVFPLGKEKQPTCFFFLIVYHVLVASEIENSTQMLNLIKDKLLRFQECDFDFHLDCSFQLYLDVYYKDNPNDIFTNIHTIWKCVKATELNLKLVYCKNLMEAKDFKTLIQLIHHHADNLIESFEEKENKQCNRPTAIVVLLHIIHYQVSLNKMERVKTIATILSRLSMSIMRYDKHFVLNGFYDFILTLDNKQLLCIPYVIKLLHSLMKEHPLDYVSMILLSIDRLRQANHYTECIEFIKSNFQFISSFPTKKLKVQGECYYRQQYCITLLLLLNEYVTCYDTHNINLMLTKLLDFRVSFLSDIQSTSCYCFMGNKQCMTVGKHLQYLPLMMLESQKRYRGMFDFKKHLLDCSILTRSSHFKDPPFHMDPRERIPHDYELMMNNVIQRESKQTSYLKSIIEMMEINKYQHESVVSFIEFIKRSADYNVASLYNIIKMICAFELKPEIEDMILQGVTVYLIISCNKQYGLLSKFILDINMICPKDQFLHKLTSGIAKTLLKFDDDTVKDFNNIIYKCYCTIRHDCRNVKDKNITKYKDHFTFIASMDAEEEMKKLTSPANLLLLLTLLLIASGGHHKSAKLKKYLSLKYEYRDTILYLLWCSGDVEINPGPTFRTLRKIPDSVKERNWIYEMCSILVRLLKYKSLDIKNKNLWNENPSGWPPEWLFYDPINKPNGSCYNVNAETDRKLLDCLEEHSNVEGIFKETTQFDDENTKFKVQQYRQEIFAWKRNQTELYESYIIRKELDTLLAAKGCLHKYSKDLKFHLHLYEIHELIFFSEEVSNCCKKSYTDIVRDIATTFGRIAKKLNYLGKSPGIWEKPPEEWNNSHPYPDQYYDTSKNRKELVDNLLTYCESKEDIKIPPELQPLVKAWKQRNKSDITKYYTIWSNTAIINHSLKYLEIEGILDKIEVQEHLKKIGVILDKQHWKCQSPQKVNSTDNDDKSQDSSFSDSSHSSPCTVNTAATTANITNSSPKVLSFPTINDNQLMKLTNSTNANLNAACDSSYCYDSHVTNHLCHTKFNLDNQWNQSSKHTCVSSCKDTCSILTLRAQPEADDKHHPISPVNFSNSKYQLISSEPNLNEQLIPSTVHIHDATSNPERNNNKISKNAKFLKVFSSSSENGKDLSITTPKGNSKDSNITTILPDDLSHDLISIKSIPHHLPLEKQTDQLVINKLPDTADDKPVDSSSCKQADNVNKKGETTLGQCVNQIIIPFEEQDYSSVVGDSSIPNTSNTTDQQSDLSNELPVYVELYINRIENRSDTTLIKDIEQFINLKEQDIDLS